MDKAGVREGMYVVAVGDLAKTDLHYSVKPTMVELRDAQVPLLVLSRLQGAVRVKDPDGYRWVFAADDLAPVGAPQVSAVEGITAEDLKVLRGAKDSNPWWFRALMAAAGVQANRRAKYSGAGDPFTNFWTVANIIRKPVAEVFRMYQAIKLARLMVTTTDFADERVQDTLVDLANYALLEAGWRMQQAEAPGNPLDH